MPNRPDHLPSKTLTPCSGVVVVGKQNACQPEFAVVGWHRHAPAKPAFGAPCNGCGLCCLAAPCPLGMWVSRRRTGICRALLWSDTDQRYQCGLLVDPALVTGWQRPWLLRWCSRLARRWIAVGIGCDADIEWEPMPPPR